MSKLSIVVSESSIHTIAPVSLESVKHIVPNFFETSDNIVETEAGVDYLSIQDQYQNFEIINSNSFFLSSPLVTIANSTIESALINIIGDHVSIKLSTLTANFETLSEDLQTLSYFEDICGENGGNNFNLGGLALPKTFDSDSEMISDADQDKIKMCKFKSIASESLLSYSNLLDLIKTGNIGTISKQVPGSIKTAGVISIMANQVSVSADSALLASVKHPFSEEYYGSPSGGSAIFVTSQFDFSGTLSVEGVNSPIYYNGAGSGGNIFIFDPLWTKKAPSQDVSHRSLWKIQMSGGNRPQAPVKGLQNKYFQAENGMVYSSFCPSGTSSISCAVCPAGSAH